MRSRGGGPQSLRSLRWVRGGLKKREREKNGPKGIKCIDALDIKGSFDLNDRKSI
jgi:hypothetical protein